MCVCVFEVCVCVEVCVFKQFRVCVFEGCVCVLRRVCFERWWWCVCSKVVCVPKGFTVRVNDESKTD